MTTDKGAALLSLPRILLDQPMRKVIILWKVIKWSSFRQVQRLYESGFYEDVVMRLMPTLHQPQPKTKVC